MRISRRFRDYVDGLLRTLRDLPGQPILRWGAYLKGRGARVATTQAQARADRLAAADPFNQPEWTPERRVLWANRVAAENHQRNVYHGRTVFFLARQSRLWRRGPHQSWSPYVTGDFDVIVIPGTHRSIIEGPELPLLAERLKAVLDHQT